jgi:hypothetical protein
MHRNEECKVGDWKEGKEHVREIIEKNMIL